VSTEASRSPAAAVSQGSPNSSLGRRILTGVIFVPILVGLAWIGGWAFTAFVSVLGALGLGEYASIARRAGTPVPKAWVVLLGAAAPIVLHVGGVVAIAPMTAAVTMLTLLRSLGRRRDELRAVAATVFGFAYVPLLLGHLVLLRDLPFPAGASSAGVLVVFLVTWACDSGAYLFGRMLGRHRPWPGISPNKSAEGAIAGVVFAVAAALASRVWFAPMLSLWAAIGLGLVMGLLCQVGDLIESAIKRQAGLKDTSALIPGHGGVLDRFDSMMFAAPAAYYFFRFVVGV
jgi:phosphatidate cytidylyltransferase